MSRQPTHEDKTPDGSLDLYIQGPSPGPELASLRGRTFNLTIRLYWPEEAILNGSWRPPDPERLP
jgi:hypothetical protein